MDNNQSLLTLSLKNLTILTFNASQTLDPKQPEFRPIMSFNSSYKFIEGVELIRSMAQVPYTNQIIFSSNRFEVIKMDKLTKEIIHRGRGPLDSTNFIVSPVPTHRPEYDPHNPNKKKDPTLSKRVTPFTELTYFIMTSADSGVNSLVDWTSFKAIKYFSMSDQKQNNQDEGISYKIRSICFFGGSPRGHLYAFVGSSIIKELYLFSAINRNILTNFALPAKSSSATVSWINHTSYIYVLLQGIQGEPSYTFRSVFYSLGPRTKKECSIVKSFFIFWSRLSTLTHH